MEETAQVLRPLGLTLSQEKTHITHVDEGFDFLGWRIKRDLGRRGRPGIFLFPSRAALRAVLGKVKEISRSGTNQTLDELNSTSKHIRVLEGAGLLRRSVRGRDHVLTLDAAPLAEAVGWIEHYRRFWSEQLASLDAFVTSRDNTPRSS